MIIDVTLNFQGGVIKPLSLVDVHEQYVNGLNDPDVNRYLDNVKRSLQTEKTVSDFIRYNIESNDSIIFGIWRDGLSKHSGTVRLHAIENTHHTAHIGICIFDKSAWGLGLGSKAISLVSNWALENLKLRWLEAGAYEENVASQRAFLSAGYKWVYDIPNKYLLNERPARVRVFALQPQPNN